MKRGTRFASFLTPARLLTTVKTIARHVMNIHMNRMDTNEEVAGEIDIDTMKKYIAYCKW